MRDDAGDLASPRRRHVDRARLPPAELEELGAAVVAQRRPGPGGEHLREELPQPRQGRMPDRVDAAMDAVQRTALDPVRDAAGTQPRGAELCRRDDAVLPLREGRKRAVDGGWGRVFRCDRARSPHPPNPRRSG